MKIISVGDMINDGIKKSKSLREAFVKAYWKDIVGNLDKKSEVIKIKDQKLFVKVEGSANLHFMTMKKGIYLKNIEKLLNGKYIQEIVYKLGKINLNNKILNEVEKPKGCFKIDEIDSVDFSDYSLEERIERLSIVSKERELFLLENGYKKCVQCGNLFLGKNLRCPKCRGIKDRTVVNKY